jgi:5'-methylthioadenosine phosphorylase
VSVEMVGRQLAANAANARKIIAAVASSFPAVREPCPFGSHRALDGAIVTAPEARDPVLVARLDAVAGRVLKARP